MKSLRILLFQYSIASYLLIFQCASGIVTTPTPSQHTSSQAPTLLPPLSTKGDYPSSICLAGNRVYGLDASGSPCYLDLGTPNTPWTTLPAYSLLQSPAPTATPRPPTKTDLQNVWALNNKGTIFFRDGISPENRTGTQWKKIDGPTGATPQQIAIGSRGGVPEVWLIVPGSPGIVYYRAGITQDRPDGTDWVTVNHNVFYQQGGSWQTGGLNAVTSIIASVDDAPAQGGGLVLIGGANGFKKRNFVFLLKSINVTQKGKDSSVNVVWTAIDSGWGDNFKHGVMTKDNLYLYSIRDDCKDNGYRYSSPQPGQNNKHTGIDDGHIGRSDAPGQMAIVGGIGCPVQLHHLGHASKWWQTSSEVFGSWNKDAAVHGSDAMSCIAGNRLGDIWGLGPSGSMHDDNRGGYAALVNSQRGSLNAWADATDGGNIYLSYIACGMRPFLTPQSSIINLNKSPVAGQFTVKLRTISASPDGTIGGIEAGIGNGKPYLFTEQCWRPLGMPGSAGITMHVGNKNNVFVKNSAGSLYWKKGSDLPTDEGWFQLPGSIIDASSGCDGFTLCITRNGQSIEQVIRTADNLATVPFVSDVGKTLGKSGVSVISISVADRHHVVLVDTDGNAWRLVGTRVIEDARTIPANIADLDARIDWLGNNDSDWEHITLDANIRCDYATISQQGIVIVRDQKSGKYFIINDDEATKNKMDVARGPEIYPNQPLNIGSPDWLQSLRAGEPLSRWLWMDESSAGKRVIHGSPDHRERVGFFCVTRVANENDVKTPIRYGEKVYVYSLVSCQGATTTVTGKRQERWWVTVEDNKISPLRISTVSLDFNKGSLPTDASSVFTIERPDGSGKGDVVHAYDTFTIVSRAPTCDGAVLWVDQSPSGQQTLSIKKGLSETTYQQNHPFGGDGSASGGHYLTARALNPDTINSPWELKGQMTGISQSPATLLQILRGNYPGYSEGFRKQQTLVALSSGNYGVGEVTTVSNQTSFPLKYVFGSASGMLTANGGFMQFNTDPNNPPVLFDKRNKVANSMDLQGVRRLEQSPGQPFVYQQGQQFDVGSMFSKGALWIDQALQSAGQATVSFVTVAGPEGDVQVVFDVYDPANLDRLINPRLRIALGHYVSQTERNAQAVILYEDAVVASTHRRDNPCAYVVPGEPMLYWVSINNGFIMVGAGTPGTNVIVAGYVPEATTFNHVGFSSHYDNVTFASVRIGKPLDIRIWGQYYTKKSQSTSSSGTISWMTNDHANQQSLRVPNEGAVSASLTASQNASIIFAAADTGKGDDEYYEICFGSSDNPSITILKKYKGAARSINVFTGSMNSANLKPFLLGKGTPPQRVWASIQDKTLAAGVWDGNNIQRPLVVWTDMFATALCSRIGFRNASQISDITLWQNVEFGPALGTQVTNVRKVDTVFWDTTLSGCQQFRYNITQNNDVVCLQSMYSATPTIYRIVGTPAQGAFYPIDITIQPTGTPLIKASDADLGPFRQNAWKSDKAAQDAINKFQLDAAKLNAASDAKMSVAQAVLTGVTAATDAASSAGGMAMQSENPVGLGIGTAMVATAVAGQVAAGVTYAIEGAQAAELRRQAAILQAKSDIAQQTLTAEQTQREQALAEQLARTVATDVINETEQITTKVSDRASDYRTQVTSLLDGVRGIPWASDKFSVLVGTYLQILRLVVDQYVVGKDGPNDPVRLEIRAGVQDAVGALQQGYGSDDPSVAPDVFEVLARAYGNPYLTDQESLNDMQVRDSWYGQLVRLGYKLFENASPDTGVSLTALRAERVWHPTTLTTADQGSITCDIVGSMPVFIGFGVTNNRVRGVSANNNGYEIALNATNTNDPQAKKMHIIRVQCLGLPAAVLLESQDPDAMLDNVNDNRICITLNRGLITVYKAKKDKTWRQIMQWQDPFPWSGVQNIGFSVWGGDVDAIFKNIEISDDTSPRSLTDTATTSTVNPALDEEPVEDVNEEELSSAETKEPASITPAPTPSKQQKPSTKSPIPSVQKPRTQLSTTATATQARVRAVGAGG